MKLTEIVHKDGIVAALTSTRRDDAITELVDALITAGGVSKTLKNDLIKSVLERESRGSTGFGKGVAVPHVKHPKIKAMTACIGNSDQGIEFNALDKQPVYSVVLLLSPADQPEQHLQAMEVIFKNLSQDTFRRFLRQASTVDEVWTLLEDADADKLVG